MKRLAVVLAILGVVAGYASADRVLAEAGVDAVHETCSISKTG